MSEEKNKNKDHEQEKKICCEDGTCSICMKSKEIEVDADSEMASVVAEAKVTENDKEKIKDEVKEIVRRGSGKSKLRDIKRESMSERSYKKNPLNKALVFVLVAVIVASVVAGVMGVNFFNKFKSDKISKDRFDGKDVVELDGETWVLQDESKVVMEVYSSEDCDDCNVDGTISFFKKEIPTLEVKEIDAKDADFDLKYIPTFAFDEKITSTDFYSRGEDLFVKEGTRYILQSAQIGFPVGEYLTEISDDTGFLVGDETADVSVIVVTDFGCEECAVANPIVNKLETEYKGKAKFTYKIFTDTEDAGMMNMSMAAFCVDEQGKFDLFADTIFARQSAWQAVEGDLINVLENYAVKSGADKVEFTECMESKKYEDKVKEINEEIVNLGIEEVPVYFVDDEKIEGVPTYTEMGAMLKEAVSGTIATTKTSTSNTTDVDSTSTTEDESETVSSTTTSTSSATEDESEDESEE